MYVPLALANPPVCTREPAAAPRVLVVEDSPSDALLLEFELQRSVPELTCEFVTDLAAAERAAGEAPPDVVLLDLLLPDSQGLGTLEQLRAKLPDTPVVVLTGTADVRLAIGSLRSGARDFFVKDDLAALGATLRRIIDDARGERERRQRDAELLRTLELESVGRLAAGVAHEINTPIQYVGDNLVFLRKAFQIMLPVVSRACELDDGPPPGEDGAQRPANYGARLSYAIAQVPEAINQALEGVSRVARVVATLRDRRDGLDGEAAELDLRQLLDATLWRCRAEWQPVARVQPRYASDLPRVRGHARDLVLAFESLLINAAESIARSPRKGAGWIGIEVERSPAGVQVCFHDDGAGIPAPHLGKLFEPFFTTKPPGSGAGHGLATVHAIIVKKHGGTVRAEPHGTRGASFIITLPIASPVSVEA